MPPQNTPNPNTVPNNPENQGQKSMPEKAMPPQNPENAPETAPAPKAPEKPAGETFQDQMSTPVPVQTQTNAPSVPQSPTDDTQAPVKDDASEVSENDKTWVNAVETTIENDKDKPYEEEEDSEKLQINYLNKRFGKKINKE